MRALVLFACSFALLVAACGNVATAPPQGTAIGGTVIGLDGSGLVLQNDGSDALTVTSSSVFWFDERVDSGATYNVTVSTQPSNPSQTCTVSGGSGTAGAADVSSITINCARNMFTLGGTVTGLAGNLVLENANGDQATVSADGSFAFPTALVSGTPYRVTVLTQPDSPQQYCAIAAGTGAVGDANVTSVAVTCSNDALPIGGKLLDLPSGTSITFGDANGGQVTLNADGSFALPTPVPSGMPYSVSITTQPAGYICSVANGTGSVGSGDPVLVECAYAFSACGATGAAGPTQAQCDGTYAGTILAGDVTSGSGIQQWTVPSTGTYRIEAIGAQGAAATIGRAGGRGASMRGDVSLSAGTVLRVLVGQAGLGQDSESNAGGGGGSFVVTSAGTIEVIGGGGGGARTDATVNGYDASTGTNGVAGTGDPSGGGAGGAGGTAGGGGSISGSWGAAGGGYSGNGANDFGTGGTAFTGGGAGGTDASAFANGGFGGGGCGFGGDGGGGGGGYSGGGGGWIAGGGGSYNAGTNQVDTAGVGYGDGSVRIWRLD